MLLTTDRLILREFTPADFEDFAKLVNQLEVMRFSLKGPLSKKDAEDYFQRRILDHYTKYGFGLLAIIHKEERKLIGFAGLIVFLIDGKEEVEIGYRLDPIYWKQGFAIEACQAICSYAFETLKLDHLIAIIDPLNHPSLKVAARLHMHFLKKSHVHGFNVDIYSLSKIIIEPFQESWTVSFQEEIKALYQVFDAIKIDFYHIGSTSIPGCMAKPILDILGIVADITLVDHVNEAMQSLGFEVMGEFGMKQRRFFRKKQKCAVNLHIFEDTDPEGERHLRFCDYLTHHREKIREYSSLKEQLSKKFLYDIKGYILGKEAFVKSVDYIAAMKTSKNRLYQRHGKRKVEWTQDEISAAMEVNWHLYRTYFAKYLPTMHILFEPDVTVLQADILNDAFNSVLAARFTENNAKHRVEHIIKLYTKKRLPFSWWISERDAPHNLEEILINHGLLFKEEIVGMTLSLDIFKPSSQTPDITFKRVHSQDMLKDFSKVIDENTQSPDVYPLIYSQVPAVLYQDNSPYKMATAYLNHEPIAAGTLILHAGMAGIYITASSSQRQQEAKLALTEFFLHDAKSEGFHRAALLSSHEDKTLYATLGFNPLSSFKRYSLGETL